jgi:ATP synthase protein I
MTEEPDAERLRALEERLAQARKKGERTPGAMRGLSQGEAGWRMVIELATGMALGLGIGYGLDALLGTRPVLMVIFALLGFAAGVRTMLKTAQSLQASQEDKTDGRAGSGDEKV